MRYGSGRTDRRRQNYIPPPSSGDNNMLSYKFVANLTIIISYNQIFELRAGARASTSVGPLPGNWLAAGIADLTPDLQVLLS